MSAVRAESHGLGWVRISRVPWELAALPALGIARALPADGAGLYLRLAAATLCLLLPGALLARALGRPGPSATLAWSLAGLFAAGAVMFAAHGTLWLALGLYAALGAVALPFAVARPLPVPSRVAIGVILAGIGFGIALWWVVGALDGDALFHLARVRKLDALGDLSLRSVDEFRDGGLHPGYAFPLWHLLLALVAKLGAVDPAAVLLHESSVLCPLAFLVAYEAGVAVFRTAWAGVAALLGQVALIGLAAGHGGSYSALALPATASRQLIVPAVVALFFSSLATPGRSATASIAAGALGLALVHPTYALFVAVPLAGYVAARALLTRSELVRGLLALAALLVPAGAVSLWLLPIVRETVSHDPDPSERARSLAKYAGQLDIDSLHSFRLAPEVFGRTGAVAVAALVVVPLAALACRRRWAALVLGGTVAVAALTLIPYVFAHFSDAVSLSQSRRVAGFVPFAAAFAGGAAVLARLLRFAVLPVALAAGIALQLAWPGDFGYGLRVGGPALAAWIAAVGGGAVLALAAVLRRPWKLDDRGWLAAAAAALFVLPVAVHGFSHWSARAGAGKSLTPGLVSALETQVPPGSVVFSDDGTSFRIAAAVPVYVASALPGHVADTEANRPYERRADARAFLRSGDLAIPRRYHAGWIVLDRRRWPRLRLPLEVVYEDRSFALYRL
jgi:hypothetical protein